MTVFSGTLRMLAVVIALSPAFAGPARGDDDSRSPAESSHACEDMTGFWPLWRALSAQSKPAPTPADTTFFPRREILAALHTAPLAGPLPSPGPESMEYYRPRSPYAAPQDVWHQTLPYAKAAEAYEKGDFAEAITQFDAIVQAGRSPAAGPSLYRAAAAYTAARAAFALGNFEDGVHVRGLAV